LTDVYRPSEDFLGKGKVAMAPEPLARAQALAVIETGLARGVETHRIIRAARMLQEYELMFWDTLLARSAHET
jgi:predicted nucleic acid-binding protein